MQTYLQEEKGGRRQDRTRAEGEGGLRTDATLWGQPQGNTWFLPRLQLRVLNHSRYSRPRLALFCRTPTLSHAPNHSSLDPNVGTTVKRGEH